jgi:hypothetical protein
MLNFLKIAFGKKEQPFTVGDSWNDYPFQTFIDYNEILEDDKPNKNERIYALFTGLDLDWWLKPHDPKLFQSLNAQLNFISEEPKCKLPTDIKRLSKGTYHRINKEFKEIKAGRYYNILNAVSSLSDESKTRDKLEVMATCIAVCGLDIVYDTEDYEEVFNEVIETMPTDEAYSLGCFFLNKLKELNGNTEKTWSIKSLTMRIIKLGLIYLAASGVTLVTYIRYPKEILRIPLRLWSFLSVMFMRGRNIIVSEIGVKRSTEI